MDRPCFRLAQAILDLERDRSMEGTLAILGGLRRIAEEIGSEYDHFMAECVGEMLISRERITKQQIREARTMAQVMTEYERSLEEFGRRRRDEGQADMLCRQVGMKFGSEVAEELRALFGVMSESSRISEAAIGVIECATPEEFLARVRRIPPT